MTARTGPQARETLHLAKEGDATDLGTEIASETRPVLYQTAGGVDRAATSCSANRCAFTNYRGRCRARR